MGTFYPPRDADVQYRRRLRAVAVQISPALLEELTEIHEEHDAGNCMARSEGDHCCLADLLLTEDLDMRRFGP